MVYGFRSFLYDIKKYYKFSKKEIRGLVLAILILGFVIGFDDGREVFEIGF